MKRTPYTKHDQRTPRNKLKWETLASAWLKYLDSVETQPNLPPDRRDLDEVLGRLKALDSTSLYYLILGSLDAGQMTALSQILVQAFRYKN